MLSYALPIVLTTHLQRFDMSCDLSVEAMCCLMDYDVCEEAFQTTEAMKALEKFSQTKTNTILSPRMLRNSASVFRVPRPGGRT